jgi:SAM-dependent methyltransferase
MMAVDQAFATLKLIMNQQEAWELEYNFSHAIPTSTRILPSSAVIKFEVLLQQEKLHNLFILDVGAGTGRNSIFLAKKGHKVTALDFSQSALTILTGKIIRKHWSNNITIVDHNLIKRLPFADNAFDAFVDITTTTSLSPSNMKRLALELRRVVKPGGLFMSYIHSKDDGYLQAISPGRDRYEVGGTGIIDYAYSEADLRKLYKDWHILDLQHIEKEDLICGESCVRRLWQIMGRTEK